MARWHAHQVELARLQRVLDTRLLLIKYEALVLNTRATLTELQTFLQLKNEFPAILQQTDSLMKWTRDLTLSDVSVIKSALEYLHSSPSL